MEEADDRKIKIQRLLYGNIMLKILKFDLYKTIHSIWFKVLLGFDVIMVALGVIGRNNDSVLRIFSQSIESASLLIIIFVSFLGSMDYNNGYEKNIVESDKYLQIISKCILITLYIIILLVLYFIASFFDSLIVNKMVVMHNPILSNYYGHEIARYEDVCGDNWTIEYFWGFLGIEFVRFVVVGLGVLCFTLIVRNRVAVVIVNLVYLFSYYYIYAFINYIIDDVKFDITNYSLMNNAFHLSFDFEKRFAFELILSIVYFAVYALLLFGMAYLQTRRKPKKVFENSVGGDLLKIKDLTKVYGKKKVLDCSLNIEEGEIYGIVGNNGAGKSTLMKLICGLIKPTEGTISFCRANDERNIKIGALIEKPGLYTGMSAFQNLKAKALCLGYDTSKESINGLLQKVGLGDVGKKKVMRFSMGMKQRLGIALALMGEPDVLVLDEPINGLDIQGINDFRKMVEQIHKESDVTILISSHIIDELYKVATSFVVMNKGVVIREMTTEELTAEKGDKPIDEYYLSIVNNADKIGQTN